MTDAELFEIELAAQWAAGKKRYGKIIGDIDGQLVISKLERTNCRAFLGCSFN